MDRGDEKSTSFALRSGYVDPAERSTYSISQVNRFMYSSAARCPFLASSPCSLPHLELLHLPSRGTPARRSNILYLYLQYEYVNCILGRNTVLRCSTNNTILRGPHSLRIRSRQVCAILKISSGQGLELELN